MEEGKEDLTEFSFESRCLPCFRTVDINRPSLQYLKGVVLLDMPSVSFRDLSSFRHVFVSRREGLWQA